MPLQTAEDIDEFFFSNTMSGREGGKALLDKMVADMSPTSATLPADMIKNPISHTDIRNKSIYCTLLDYMVNPFFPGAYHMSCSGWRSGGQDRDDC